MRLNTRTKSDVLGEPAEVILSTFNGERYLADQLQSIADQTYQDISLRIRDDGSDIETRKILAKFVECNPWAKCTFGENIGVIGSFLELLNTVGEEIQYVALCDQDDIWDADKIERAISKLKSVPANKPALYFSAVRLCRGESVEEFGRTRLCRPPSIRNALVQNVATGCTIVLNRAAVDLFRDVPIDHSKLTMHDSWLYLVVSAIGTIIYDPRPSMSYRQHADNVVGSTTGLRLWARRLSRFRRRSRRQLVERAEQLMAAYGDALDDDSRELISDFIRNAGSTSIIRRLKYAIAAPVYRQTSLDDLVMRILVVLGWR